MPCRQWFAVFVFASAFLFELVSVDGLMCALVLCFVVGVFVRQRSTNQGEKTVIDHVVHFDSKQVNDIIPDGAAAAKTYKDVDNLALELATDIESSTIIPLSKIHSIKFSRSGFTIFTLVGEVMNKYVDRALGERSREDDSNYSFLEYFLTIYILLLRVTFSCDDIYMQIDVHVVVCQRLVSSMVRCTLVSHENSEESRNAVYFIVGFIYSFAPLSGSLCFLFFIFDPHCVGLIATEISSWTPATSLRTPDQGSRSYSRASPLNLRDSKPPATMHWTISSCSKQQRNEENTTSRGFFARNTSRS